jgi:hypothetical protein
MDAVKFSIPFAKITHFVHALPVKLAIFLPAMEFARKNHKIVSFMTMSKTNV